MNTPDMVTTFAPAPAEASAETRCIHALLLADRLTVDRGAFKEPISTTPFAFRKGAGFVVLFRYGVAVLIGLTRSEEREILAQIAPGAGSPVEEERVEFVVTPDSEDGVTAMNIVQVREMSPARALVIADMLAKSVAL